MDRGALQDTVHVIQETDMIKQLIMNAPFPQQSAVCKGLPCTLSTVMLTGNVWRAYYPGSRGEETHVCSGSLNTPTGKFQSQELKLDVSAPPAMARQTFPIKDQTVHIF